MRKKFNFIILGPQGSGKGTQARLLSEKLNAPIISMGEISRKSRERNNEIGKTARYYYDKGMLFPTELIGKLLEKELEKMNLSKTIIFEGVPRNLKQVEVFNEILKKLKIPQPIMIYLNISKETGFKRINGRKVCSKCSTPILPADSNYSSGICAKCSGKLIVRPDDQSDAIKKRLDSYYKETEPVIELYRKSGNLLEINGEPSVDEVDKEVNEKIKQLGVIWLILKVMKKLR